MKVYIIEETITFDFRSEVIPRYDLGPFVDRESALTEIYKLIEEHIKQIKNYKDPDWHGIGSIDDMAKAVDLETLDTGRDKNGAWTRYRHCNCPACDISIIHTFDLKEMDTMGTRDS